MRSPGCHRQNCRRVRLLSTASSCPRSSEQGVCAVQDLRRNLLQRAPEPNGTLNIEWGGGGRQREHCGKSTVHLGSRAGREQAGSKRARLARPEHRKVLLRPIPEQSNGPFIRRRQVAAGNETVCSFNWGGIRAEHWRPNTAAAAGLRSVLTATQAGVGPTTTKPPSLPQGQPLAPMRTNKAFKSATSRSGASVSSRAERPCRRTQIVVQPSRLAGEISVTPSATWRCSADRSRGGAKLPRRWPGAVCNNGPVRP